MKPASHGTRGDARPNIGMKGKEPKKFTISEQNTDTRGRIDSIQPPKQAGKGDRIMGHSPSAQPRGGDCRGTIETPTDSAEQTNQRTPTKNRDQEAYVIRSSDLQRFLQQVRQEKGSSEPQKGGSVSAAQRSGGAKPQESTRNQPVSPTNNLKKSASSSLLQVGESIASPPRNRAAPTVESPNGASAPASRSPTDLQKEIEELQQRYFRNPSRGGLKKINVFEGSSAPSPSGPPSPIHGIRNGCRTDPRGAETQSHVSSIQSFGSAPVSNGHQESQDRRDGDVAAMQTIQHYELSSIQENDETMTSENSVLERGNTLDKNAPTFTGQKENNHPRSVRNGNANKKKNTQKNHQVNRTSNGTGSNNKQTKSSIPCRIPVPRQRLSNQTSVVKEGENFSNVIRSPAELLDDEGEDSLADLPGTNTFVMDDESRNSITMSMALEGSHHFIQPQQLDLKKTIWNESDTYPHPERKQNRATMRLGSSRDESMLEKSIIGNSEFVLPPEDGEFAS